MSAVVDYAQAGELKFGQVGIANLRVRTLDVAQLAAEMRDRVQRAPNLFARAAVVLDFGGLSQVPTLEDARALVEGLRDAGVLAVALAYGTKEIEALSQQLGLPLLAKFRAQYERAEEASVGAASAASSSRPPAQQEIAAEAAPTKAASAKAAPSAGPGLMQTAPVRSGQQVYAENRDLTVLSAVG
ncbi:MAG: septum site-determining protein MinC, partial [Thermomonas sp.]